LVYEDVRSKIITELRKRKRKQNKNKQTSKQTKESKADNFKKEVTDTKQNGKK